MKTRHLLASLAVAYTLAAAGSAHEEAAPEPQPVVQIALLLDTSNSMDGLINQARTQLWKIVNQFNNCHRGGKAPRLQVALYEYGNNSLAAGEGYVRMVLPLTGDLDLVSEKLWSLKTNGGSEYCGQVIHNAVEELAWSRDKADYRAIFIAGNEPFTQGSTDCRQSCAEALGKGIIITTIHCGPEQIGREGKWNEGAKLGEGKFLNIDQDRACVAIATPHDDELARLSGELNKTYIPYGAAGREGRERQFEQDQQAQQAAPAAAAERAASKASDNYSNARWDLADAVKENKVRLGSVSKDELPEPMRDMSPEQREAYVKEQIASREKIQSEIASLTAKREAYIAEEQKKQDNSGADTLDTAVLKAVAEQLSAKGFEAK
jgi:hypothetical protein